MASINESGRSTPSSQTDGANLERAADQGARNKSKGAFSALKGRKGTLEKVGSPSRSLNKQQDTVAKIDRNFRARLDELQVSKGRGGGATAGKQSVSAGQEQAQRQEQQQARAQQPSTSGATQAPPPKPAKTEGKVLRELPQDFSGATQAPPPKPTKTDGKVIKELPQDSSVAMKAEAGDKVIYSTIDEVAKANARANRVAPEAAPVPAPRPAPALPQRPTPRVALRSPSDDKFLAGGGFNPSSTLGRVRSAIAMAGEPVAFESRRASVRTPAPPRLSLGKRILNAFKKFFHIGSARAGSRVEARPMRTEESLIFAQETETELRKGFAKSTRLGTEEKAAYDVASQRVVNLLTNTAKNVADDGEYFPTTRADIKKELDGISLLFDEDRIYDTVENARASAQGGTGGDA